ncbi:hypothetical protein ACG2F4_08495 [Halalkalibaculum sp. DA3122]
MAQETKSYELLPYPDVWYNDVDGIRAGVRVTGQVPGTFQDGPHRLNAGIWLGTWWPEDPISYNVEFTEPIPSISGFNSEGNIRLASSIRAGFSRHGIQFNKRWQPGFDERQFVTFSAGITAQKRFDDSYLLFPHTWQQEWLWLGTLGFELNNANVLGRYQVKADVKANIAGETSPFVYAAVELKQQFLLGSGFGLHTRLFSGLASEKTAPEFLFSRSFRPIVQWNQNSLVRAKGTIPTSWMSTGLFQVAGGANLRGYSEQDISALENGLSPLLTSVGALNIELDYPNPLDRAIRNIPVIGNFMRLRSYIFNDTGTSLGLTSLEESHVLSDAGLGFTFSFNIPDYLGNPRGLVLRYDLPLWVSHPQENSHFSFRHVIGIGAVFTF